MKNFYIIILLVFFISCDFGIIDMSTIDNLDFTYNGITYKLDSKAQRHRDGKNISLKIYSEEISNDIGITILVEKYTDAFNYKNIPVPYLFEDDKVRFIIITEYYYESVEGRLNIIKDDDRKIKGEFEFTAVNEFEEGDTIKITSGFFEIPYSTSTATKMYY